MKKPIVAPMDTIFGAPATVRDAPVTALKKHKKRRKVHKATDAAGRHQGYFLNRGRAFGAAGPSGDVQQMDESDMPDGSVPEDEGMDATPPADPDNDEYE